MMKGILVSKNGGTHWDVLSCAEFEKDYHIKPKQSERIYTLGQQGRDYYIVSWPLVCGIFIDGELFYVDYCPNIIINGQPKMELIPDSDVVETIEEVYDKIRKMNEHWLTYPEQILEWPSR